MDFVVAIYECTEKLPDSERFGLVQQMRRAAVSIPSNISEGFGRSSKTELARYVDIALGSVRELQTQLEICERLKFLDAKFELGCAEELAKILFAFAKSLRRNGTGQEQS